jgi:hypothetical protein
MRISLLTISLGLILLFIFSCKKDKKTTTTTTAPLFCSLQMSSIVINDTVLFIIKDTSYTTGNNTFYTEHKLSDTRGGSFDFEGTQAPVQGKYVITSNFTEVLPGSKKVYIQYFLNGTSFQAQSGEVTVTGAGTAAIVEFCKISFQNSFNDNFTISFKSDMQ